MTVNAKRFSAVCFCCKTFHTKIIEDYNGANWSQRIIECCGDPLTLQMVGKSKSWKKPLHKCNSSCKHASRSTECNCECGGIGHGALAREEAPRAI